MSRGFIQRSLLKIDLLVLAFFVGLTVMLIPYLLIGARADRSVGQAIWLVVMIGIIYSASVAAALGTSGSRWRPLTRASASALIAGFAASITTILIQAAAYRSIASSWQRFQVRWPWMLVACATAAVLSFQIHNNWRRLSWLWNALIQAALMTIVALVVSRLLYFFGDHKELWQTAMRVAECGVIGFILGALVPSQFQAKKSNEVEGGGVLPQPIKESLQRRSHTGLPWWVGD
jgi:hypothetical protein